RRLWQSASRPSMTAGGVMDLRPKRAKASSRLFVGEQSKEPGEVRQSPKLDPVALAVMNNRLAAIAEEMGVVLGQTAYSPNIKERRDYSCALFDGRGELVAQAAHIPVHLGSTPLSVRAAIERLDLQAGDVAAVNEPFAGGTH